MDENAKREHITFRTKQLLENNNIKLWLPPYYKENEENTSSQISDSIYKLASQYYTILDIDIQMCAEVLLKLQQKSLQRLGERNQFESEGLATIRVKVSGQNVPEFSIHLKLCSSGDFLRKSIAEKINISADRLKLISRGKILKFDQILEEQKMKHGNTVLVMVLPSVDGNTSNVVDNVDERVLYETKKDLEFLTEKAKSKNMISVTDQEGHFLNIPETSRAGLLTAMTLHEKGRAAFKRGTFSLALLFYLEADNEFKSCQSDLLDKVDNYAILNLDIVWCYLHLQNFQYLADAEARLKICETTFNRCYGSNLERLIALKGTSGNEHVLLVRLHLLQAILHHLLNRKELARKMFDQVENEIRKLKVNEDKMLQLMAALDCNVKEARLGLRASYNDENAAYDFIIKEREIKKRRKAVEKLKVLTDYCICGNGRCVDAEAVMELNNMGYTKLLSISGLMNTNNNLNATIIWINHFSEKLKNLHPPSVFDVLMAVDIDLKENARIFSANNFKLDDKCIAELVATSIGREQVVELPPNPSNSDQNVTTVSSNEVPTSSNFTSEENSRHKNQLYPEELTAYKRLKEDLSDTTDDYLDTTLESEENFLSIYRSLLS